MSRMDKVNQQVKKEISQIILQDLADPRVSFASITSVNVSPDLRTARVYFSVLGNSSQIKEIQKVLDGARGFIRKLLGNRMHIRYNPELTFLYDDSIDKIFQLEETIQEINDEPKGDQEDNRE